MIRSLFFFAALFWSCPGFSLSLSTASGPHVEAEILAETQSIQPGGDFWIGINLTMEPGWHTYWKNPGDTGLPTKVLWKLPKGFTASEIHWPSPSRFDLANLTNYGYEGEVLLLTKITAPRKISAKSLSIAGNVSWLVCQEQCIPGAVDLELRLPVGTQKPELNQIERQRFDRARSLLPRDWEREKIAVSQREQEISLLLIGLSPLLPRHAKLEFFPASQGVIAPQAQQLISKEKNGNVLVVLKSIATNPTNLVGELVVRGHNETFSISVNHPVSMQEAQESSLLQLLIFAFIGGLILNLMPCVLPVLGMKILSLLKKSSQERRQAKIFAWAYTLGVLVSFWLLSLVLFLFRSSGERLGWGFQLQSSVFLLAMIYLFLLIAFHFLGFFRLGERVSGWGSSLADREGWSGSFFTGVLAVVVASPCTAPFMGAALGAALLQPPWVGFLIFTALGFGLAMPFLAFSYFPGAWRILPKPGIWMERLKQFFALPMFATVAWLFWVLAQQLNTFALGIAASFVGILVILLLMRSYFLLPFVVLSLILATFGLQIPAVNSMPMWKDMGAANLIAWEAFSTEKLEQARKEGKNIFIDFTAAWCISCQVNERLVLNNEEIQKEFLTKKILAMRADWTNRDPAITKALESYSRLGVPLYVLYRAGEQNPILLPQVLTTGAVLSELRKIKNL